MSRSKQISLVSRQGTFFFFSTFLSNPRFILITVLSYCVPDRSNQNSSLIFIYLFLFFFQIYSPRNVPNSGRMIERNMLCRRLSRGTWTDTLINRKRATITLDGAARAEGNWWEETVNGFDTGGNRGQVDTVFSHRDRIPSNGLVIFFPLFSTARLFDYFDSGVMEGLQHRLLQLAKSRTQGRLAETPGNSMALTSQVRRDTHSLYVYIHDRS